MLFIYSFLLQESWIEWYQSSATRDILSITKPAILVIMPRTSKYFRWIVKQHGIWISYHTQVILCVLNISKSHWIFLMTRVVFCRYLKSNKIHYLPQDIFFNLTELLFLYVLLFVLTWSQPLPSPTPFFFRAEYVMEPQVKILRSWVRLGLIEGKGGQIKTNKQFKIEMRGRH